MEGGVKHNEPQGSSVYVHFLPPRNCLYYCQQAGGAQGEAALLVQVCVYARFRYTWLHVGVFLTILIMKSSLL